MDAYKNLMMLTVILLDVLLVSSAYSQAAPTQSTLPRKPVIRQTSSATCGPAALATLFSFYFDDATTEQEMIKLVGMKKKTVSTIKELRDASLRKGYLAQGFEMTLPEMLNAVQLLGSPVIVHFKRPTQHFVLVLGRVDNFILVADPGAGEISLDVADFSRRWDKNVLVVTSEHAPNSALIEYRKRSTETRVNTLRRVNSIMSSRRF